MEAKVKTLEINRTWTLIDLSPRILFTLVNNWVYKIKRKSHGTIERY